ncbi:diphthine methyl ester synthase isoform X2 [Ceratina calcarata]|nr:diphthine methyl ester synthase isoform X2 [Ceratina calcarata]
MEADRELVESNVDEILPKENENVAFLVVGDPLGATTHTDLILRAREKNVNVKIVHNSSILTAIGCCGLQLYRFGETVSIPYWNKDWRPTSFYERIVSNRQRDLHTLCLLDIKVKEPTIESIVKKKREYMPPQFMSVSEAAVQLLQIIEDRKETQVPGALNESSLAVGLARVGWDNQSIEVCTLEEMARTELGPPLHCLIIPSINLHPIESALINLYKNKE